MLYMISSRSVTDDVSLLVTLMCLLTRQQLLQFLAAIHKLFYLSGEFCIFEDKRLRRIGRVTQSTFLPVTSPKVKQF